MYVKHKSIVSHKVYKETKTDSRTASSIAWYGIIYQIYPRPGSRLWHPRTNPARNKTHLHLSPGSYILNISYLLNTNQSPLAPPQMEWWGQCRVWPVASIGASKQTRTALNMLGFIIIMGSVAEGCSLGLFM